MKPYYEHGGITIYHGDCREVIPSLIPDSVDLIVSDPPYGVMWESGHRQKNFGLIVGDDSKESAIEGTRLALSLLKRGRHVYLFGQYPLLSLPLSEPVELIWDKQNQNSGDLGLPWGNQHEYIQFAVYNISNANRAAGAGRYSARMRKGSVLRCLRPNGSAVCNHPTEKPVRLLRELIESSSCIGETVLDHFAGSGSTLVAAQMESRRAIGIEIEERYCEIAAKRLSQEVLDFAEATA
jgi:DNA modification methylase